MMTKMSANEQRGHWTSCGQATGALSSGIDRWELLECVAELRKPLGVSDRDLRILQAHLSVLPKGPLLAANPNVSFMSGAEVCRRAMGIEEHTRLRAEQRLEKAGLVTRRMSANRRRFAVRDGEGKVRSGYGIDLTPLVERADELMQLRESFRAAEAQKAEMRSSLRAKLRELEDLTLAAVNDTHALLERIQAWRTVLRRRTLALLDLKSMAAEMKAIEAKIKPEEEKATELARTETMYRGSDAQSDKKTVDDEQNVGHIESNQKDSKKRTSVYSGQSNTQPPTLHHCKEWTELKELQAFYPRPPTNVRDLLCKLFEFGGFLGLRKRVLSNAVARLGPDGAAILLDYIAGQIGRIPNPEGYLESLLRANARGETIAGGRLHRGRASI
jgi:replication initiation protein RepC